MTSNEFEDVTTALSPRPFNLSTHLAFALGAQRERGASPSSLRIFHFTGDNALSIERGLDDGQI